MMRITDILENKTGFIWPYEKVYIVQWDDDFWGDLQYCETIEEERYLVIDDHLCCAFAEANFSRGILNWLEEIQGEEQ